MNSEPIMIDCEGSRSRAHNPHYRAVIADRICYGHARVGMCPMCGEQVGIDQECLTVAHQRDDVLARIARGDFDES